MIVSDEVVTWFQSKVSKRIKHCLLNSRDKSIDKAFGSDSPVKLNSYGWMMKNLATITGEKESQILVMTSTAFLSRKTVNGRIPIVSMTSTLHASMIPSRPLLLVEQCLIGSHLRMESIQYILRK